MASAKLPGQTKTQLALPWFMTVPIKRFFSAEKFRILSLAGTLSIVTMTSHLGCDVIIKIAARLKYGGVREDPTAVFTEFLTSLALESTAASFRICRTERTGNGRLKRCSDLVAAGWGVHYLERLLAGLHRVIPWENDLLIFPCHLSSRICHSKLRTRYGCFLCWWEEQALRSLCHSSWPGSRSRRRAHSAVIDTPVPDL